MRQDIINIEPAPFGSLEYEGLKTLWCEVFGDEPGFVDAVYNCFGEDISGWVIKDPEGRVCSALTCYRCGSFEDKPVYVSYAICTRADSRGHGFAGMLTEYIRDRIISSGGISLVSPADQSLEEFYLKLGYEPFFFASELVAMSPEFDADEYDDSDDYDEFGRDFPEDGTHKTFEPDITIEHISADIYNRYREAYLMGVQHIELSDSLLKLIEAESLDGCGLYAINHGDAICVLRDVSSAEAVVAELITNPVLLEISGEIEHEIASMIAKNYGSVETVYRTPGYGRCQSMAAGMSKNTCDAYFGFPID